MMNADNTGSDGGDRDNVHDLGPRRAVRRRREAMDRRRTEYRAQARGQVREIGTEWLEILAGEIQAELWRRGAAPPGGAGRGRGTGRGGSSRRKSAREVDQGLAGLFREKVLSFPGRSGMSASRFGREATGDPSLVRRLRQGQVPRVDTADRVLAFMGEAPWAPVFVLEVEAFVKTTRIKEYVFSREASGNRSFLSYLRRGYMPRLDTVDRVRSWMQAHCTAEEWERITAMAREKAPDPPPGEAPWMAVMAEREERFCDGVTRLDTKAAAALAGLSPGTLSDYRGAGRGPAFHRIGRRVCYLREDVEGWMRRREREGGRGGRKGAGKDAP